MKKIILTCDRCGRVLEGEFSHITTDRGEYDFCEECDKELDAIIDEYATAKEKQKIDLRGDEV